MRDFRGRLNRLARSVGTAARPWSGPGADARYVAAWVSADLAGGLIRNEGPPEILAETRTELGVSEWADAATIRQAALEHAKTELRLSAAELREFTTWLDEAIADPAEFGGGEPFCGGGPPRAERPQNGGPAS
ncbi:MAG: hypothetical protein ACYC61_14125 [Isosphaeraceae bacterium]